MSDLKDNVERTQPTAAPVRMIDIGDIHVGKRLRALKQEKVVELADSMARQGQLQPIVVREPNHRTDTVSAKYVLLAGLHRLQAALTSLGWVQIQATVLDYGDCADIDAAALVEIDENLCRAELEPAERAAHIGRRKELYEKLHPETKTGKAPGKAGGGKKAKGVKSTSFAKATAKATGRSKSSIEKDAKRAKDLDKFLDKISGTSLDTGVEMDALCKLSEAEQEDLVARAAAGEAVSAKAALAAKKSGAKSTTIEFPEHQGGSQPVLMASAEKPIDQVQAEFAALASDETLAPVDDMSVPLPFRRVAPEAAPASHAPASNGHAEAFHVRLYEELQDVIAMCDIDKNWPEMSVKDRNRRKQLIAELHVLTHALVALATPTKH